MSLERLDAVSGEAFSSSTSSALAQSNFLALASFSFLLTVENGVGVAEDEANLVVDLPNPELSSILLPTVTLSPSQAGLLQMEEEGPGNAPLGAPSPILPVSSPPSTPPAQPRKEPTALPGTESRNDTDRINLDLFFARAVQDPFGEQLELPVNSLLPGDRLEAALLLCGGFFGLGFEVVPVGTDTERRRTLYPSGPIRR